MSDYGIQVRGLNGKMIELTSGLRMVRQVFSGEIPLKWSDGTSYQSIAGLTSGSVLMCVADQMMWAGQGRSLCISSYGRDGDGIRFWHDAPNQGDGVIRCRVFETIPAGTYPDYGILLQDSVQLSVIGKDKVSYVVHMEEFNFTGGYTLPSNVPYRDNAIMFVNWIGGDDVSIVPNDRWSISGWKRSGDGGTQDGINMTMRVIAVAQIPQLTLPEYGIAIWNTAGELTFTTGYTPLTYHSVADLNGGSNFNAGCSRPMVPVLQMGCRTVGGDYKTIFDCGVGMNSNGQIYGNVGRVRYSGAASVVINRDLDINNRVLVINSDNYF